MEAYRHFNLSSPPFESEPDPQFYVETPTHAETRATLRYAFRTGKPCCVVLGESGSGKTMMARLFAEEANARAHVLWVHGIGQPGDSTEVTIHPATTQPTAVMPPPSAVQTTLAAWLRETGAAPRRSVLVVDNADALRGHGWDDILAILTRESCTNGAVTVVLFGLPNLVEKLAGPRMVRLRRRIFRVCQLDRLSRDELEQYVRYRFSAVGGDDIPFTAAAIDMIHQLTGGNPALANQICDNTLIDAYGDDRQEIAERHVAATVRTITSSPQARQRIGATGLRQLTAGKTSRVSQLSQVAERVRKLMDGEIVTADGQTVIECNVDHEDNAKPVVSVENDDAAAATGTPVAKDDEPAATTPTATDNAVPTSCDEEPAAETTPAVSRDSDAVAPLDDATPSSAPAESDDTAEIRNVLAERLRMVEGRINDALERVRQARTGRTAEMPAESSAEKLVDIAHDDGKA